MDIKKYLEETIGDSLEELNYTITTDKDGIITIKGVGHTAPKKIIEVSHSSLNVPCKGYEEIIKDYIYMVLNKDLDDPLEILTHHILMSGIIYISSDVYNILSFIDNSIDLLYDVAKEIVHSKYVESGISGMYSAKFIYNAISAFINFCKMYVCV